MSALRIAIVGGHGNVSMRLARLLSKNDGTRVTSIFRNEEHKNEVAATGAEPLVMSLEDASKEEFAQVFEGQDVVYFSAGAGGKGGAERTRKVDFEGAVKIFDAIESVKDPRPRLILVSAIDSRDRSAPLPAHYTEEDKIASDKVWNAIGTYMQAKYDADKNLAGRKSFHWTILRPGSLSNEPGTGRARVGKAPLGTSISRDDVAYTLALLAERPDAAGLAIDLNGGDNDIPSALDVFIKAGESDFQS